MLFIQAAVIARSVSDEAIQKPSVRYREPLDCFALLAMTT